MRKYKAVVIDGRKWFYRLILTGFLSFILFVMGTFLSSNISELSFLSKPEFILEQTLPITAETDTDIPDKINRGASLFRRVVSRLSGIPVSPVGVLGQSLPVTVAVEQSLLLQQTTQNTLSTPAPPSPVPTPDLAMAPALPQDIPPEHRAPIQSINACPQKDGASKIILSNETDYGIQIDEMLASAPNLKLNQAGPKVLIVHTHATEAYSPEGATVYDITSGDRTTDTEKNVVKVGTVIAEIFQKKGIETLHDTTLHDHPSFNGSYASSLQSIENYLAQYPSIQVVLDIHRDSIIYSNQTKARPCTQINGKSAAQLMFVVGTDQNGLTHPNWRENLKTAIHFQKAILEKYPTLMRHINLRRERFNGHTTHGSLIIEVGSDGNYLSEAEYGLSLAAECIASYLNTLKQ